MFRSAGTGSFADFCLAVHKFKKENDMTPYLLHGGDIYGLDRPVLDFSVNINPLGMPEGAVRAAEEGICLSGRYPDWKKRDLICAIRDFHHLPENEGQIVCGNGVAELLYALCLYLSRKAGEKKSERCAFTWTDDGRPVQETPMLPTYWTYLPTFMEYETAAEAAGMSRAACEEEADVIFVCNPNNPTGALQTREQLMRLFRRCWERDAVLVVDESFLPFLENDASLSLLQAAIQVPNLFVLRSFTKIYAMPGLRLGYLACARKQDAEGIQRFLQPWNVSTPAQMAGVAALEDHDYLARSRAFIKKERSEMAAAISDILHTEVEGAADFLLFHADRGLGGRLLQQGILIRDCSDIRGMSRGWYRVGVRVHEDDQKLVCALSRTM